MCVCDYLLLYSLSSLVDGREEGCTDFLVVIRMVVVANIQMRTLKTEVEKGSM